ncbi:MAG: PAP2 family protein, partial [Pseudolabrys sp.]
MNRAGLAIALVIAAVVGVVFAVFPRLDLDLAALFFD